MRCQRLLIAIAAGVSITACDSDSPVDPLSTGQALSTRTEGASDITTTPASPSEIDLTWQGSTTRVDGYQVFRSTSGPTGTYSKIATTASTGSTYADVGLTASTMYCYQVRSFRTTGRNTTYSAFSGVGCATTPAPPINAPSDVNAIPTPEIYYIDAVNSPVRVSWKDNSDNEDGFRIERSTALDGQWTEAVTAVANVTSWYVTARREQQTCYRIIAVSTAGFSTPSSPDCTTPPANPTNLVARAAGAQTIALTWSDNSATEDGYTVARLDASGTWTDVATLPANAASYNDITARADITYTYRVRALKDGGFSEYSNEAAAVIAAVAPASPVNASAGYWVDNEYGWLYLDVSWEDASVNEAGFRIESSPDGVSGWQTHSIVGANTTISEDKLSLWDSLIPLSGCYRVIAFNGAGDSSPSDVTCAEWFTPPADVTATPVDRQTIQLKWTDNAHFEYGYVIFRSTTIDGPYDIITETSPNVTSYRDTGLASGQEYWYLLETDLGGYSLYDGFEYSNYASATTPSGESAMVAPQSSRTLVNNHTTAIRIRSSPALDAVRARHGKAPMGSLLPRRAPQPSRHAPHQRHK